MAAQNRVLSGNRLKWLENEVTAWQNEGIINQVQAKTILTRYAESRREADAERGEKLVTVLAVLGALLLGIGVIIFFAANWQAMPKWLKVSLIFGGVITSYGTGYYLTFIRQNHPRVGRALIFLGSVLYGAGIWLIAQVFHISSHYPNGVLLWVLGIFPLIPLCRSLSVLIEASLLLALWTVLEQTGFENINLVYLPLAAVMLFAGYKLNSAVAAGVTLTGTVAWAALANTVSFDRTGQAVIYTLFLTAVLGLFIYAIGCLHKLQESLSDMRMPYQVTGLLTALGSLFLLSFKLFGRFYGDATGASNSTFFLTAFPGLILSVIAAVLYIAVKKGFDRGGAQVGSLLVIVSLLAGTLAFTVHLLDGAVFLAVINILLFFIIVAVIILGYFSREPVLVNVGLGFFVFDVVARYFDFFWDMLPKSAFFIAGGLLLLVGGTLLERNRRKIVREMQVNDYAS